jgi:outer membrane protein assembly factor BamB
LFTLTAIFLISSCTSIPNTKANNSSIWPQAAGPQHNWAGVGPAAPINWSVARNENILWRTPLPNGGQSGIAVWDDRLFLTTYTKNTGGDDRLSADISGHCVDAATGEILWTVSLKGSVKSPMLYAYSDSTTPTPVTDGNLVVFTNASGVMAAFDYDGNEVWRRQWSPWGRPPYPFNKQHEPILYNGMVVNVEPRDGNPEEVFGWNYLRGIDIKTGQTLWEAKDGTTTYTTSVFGFAPDGRPAIMTGRGGHHGVPERPIGLSLISLAQGEQGETIWRFEPRTDNDGRLLEKGEVLGNTHAWQVLWVMHWNKKHAYMFNLNPEESHVVIDANNGEMLAKTSMINNVDYRPWDISKNEHRLFENVNIRDMQDWSPRVNAGPENYIYVYPAWHTNIVAEGYHYFLTSTAHTRNKRAHPKGKAGPSHSIGRVHIESGKTEYFELPVTVIRKSGQPDNFVYGVEVKTSTLDSQGKEAAGNARSKTDGASFPVFWGSPTNINGTLYFHTTLGITYAIDADAPVLDATAVLAINDLGPSGETWSLNSISYADGKIYHRSLKELVAIGSEP